MHKLREGTVYWLEGEIEQRLTKITKAWKLKFTENFFRIGKLKIINTWGDDPKPLPATVSTKLTKNVGWSRASVIKSIPIDEDSAIEISPSDIPMTRREEEIDQSDAEETSEDNLSDETVRGASGRVMKLPDATNNETDTESMNNIRIMNDKAEDDASSGMSEVEEEEPQAGRTVRNLRTIHPDDWLTDEKADQTLDKLKKGIQGNTTNKYGEKAKATSRSNY